MKFNYKFSNLLGVVYKQGNLIFTPDGNCVLSPVGNRVSMFDLVNDKSVTFPFENRRNISRMALSPNGNILITVDVDGKALLINFRRQVVLQHFNFKSKVNDIQFSPDSKYVAVALGRLIQVWSTPKCEKEFSPFSLLRTYGGHLDDISSIDWSADSKYFVTGSHDMSVRVYTLNPVEGYEPFTLSGHRDKVVRAFISNDCDYIYAVVKDGMLAKWKFQRDTEADSCDADENDPLKLTKGGFVLEDKSFFFQNSTVVSACFQKKNGLLTVGFSSGVFSLYELPDFNCIHKLSISQRKIDHVCVNPTGEWIAFGCSKIGQILVWEWQSESYMLKQQGHHYDMNCIAYSQDGSLIATGGEDGKVKVWNTVTGFCFVTFTEHTAAVTGIEFTKNGKVILSSSSDGTIRAFDLIRYRNFKTYTSPKPVQFNSIAVDLPGEIICAGTLDTFEIYVWSMQTGRLLDILSGHEGPVSSLSFHPDGTILFSGSWDKTVKIWDVFNRTKQIDTLNHNSEVLAIALRHDGKELCVSTLNGEISIWDPEEAKQIGSLFGRRDALPGRKEKDLMVYSNHQAAFKSLSYAPHGSLLLAGGSSRFLCIYDTADKILLKRFEMSCNLDFDGMQEKLNSKNLTEAGPLAAIDDVDSDSDVENRINTYLPVQGVQRGDLSERKTKPQFRIKSVRFSPTGESFAASSTEGLIVYSQDDELMFDPLDLDIQITPETIDEVLKEPNFFKALLMSFRLNEKPIIEKVYNAIPVEAITYISLKWPTVYLQPLIEFLADQTDKTPRVENLLDWATTILTDHGKYISVNKKAFNTSIKHLFKGIKILYKEIGTLSNDTKYLVKYLIRIGKRVEELEKEEQRFIEMFEPMSLVDEVPDQ